MTYVSKKEKVFDLPDQDETSNVSLAQPETKLKRFPSVSDRRAWTTEECQRYQHLYGLVNGSESNISKSASFKYIPFDVLLAILMAEKDAYIQELLDRQEDRSSCGGKLYKADGFEDSDDDREALIRKDAEVVALKNKISGLESELEDYRDTLTKAMHKLENMDAIMSENSLLREKITCSEETIKCLEERKAELEKELEYYRRTYNTPTNLEEKKKHMELIKQWDGGDCKEIVRLSSERDVLLQQVEELQKELERTRSNAAEVEVLKKVSETTSSSLEELSKENECYKMKLESMKCLEKYIEELKKQAQTLTEKYKRESQKANDHLRQISINNKELQMLREERDKLQVRVNELTSYEDQYLSLKAKLHQVELIIDENEMLNKKVMQLDRLELENEQLRMRLEQVKGAEIQIVEDKEKILHLQCALVEQEEEIRTLVKQIDDMNHGYSDKSEIRLLRNELEEKNGKLKKYERQLGEIPVLESEIDDLKNKLQKCIDDFKADKDLLRRLQEELEACRKRCHELEEMAPLCQAEPVAKPETGDHNVTLSPICEEAGEEKRDFSEKGENTEEIAKLDAESQSVRAKSEDKSTLIVDEAVDRVKVMEEQNEVLKGEVEVLRTKLSKIDLDELIVQTNELKNLLMAKDNKIQELTEEVTSIKKEVATYEKIKRSLEDELGLYRERTDLMKKEICLQLEDIRHLKNCIAVETKGREFAIDLVKNLEEKLDTEKMKREAEIAIMKLQKEEANIAKHEMYISFSKEIDGVKAVNKTSKKLIMELETENEILREIKQYLEDTENKALKDLISRLRAEIAALKSLSKPELEGECDALQKQVKALLKETDSLIDEIQELRAALDSEKTAKDSLEKEVLNLQSELSACVTAGNEALAQEISAKDTLISKLREELTSSNNSFENSVNECQILKDKNEDLESRNQKLKENCNALETERKDLKNCINLLESQVDELKKQADELKKQVDELKEQVDEQKKQADEQKKQADEQKKQADEQKKQADEQKKQADEQMKQADEQKKQVEELKKQVVELEEREKQQLEEIREFQGMCSTIKAQEDELIIFRESANVMREKIRELEESVKAKEEELETAKKASVDVKNEMKKLQSEMEVLKSRLAEKNTTDNPEAQDLPNYEKDLEEKYALEETLRSLEGELDELKGKLEECKTMEEEMVNLRGKRDSLLQKMSAFENEIDGLKRKLSDFESLKTELDQLRAEKMLMNTDMEVSSLYQQLLEYKSQITGLKKENEILKEDLKKTEALLEVSKNLKKNIPEIQVSTAAEFFTPPVLPSPRSSGPSLQESFPEAIPIETHRKEINDLENLYEMKIRHLSEANSERLKKLLEQHEKEAQIRSKTFHDSINSVKSSYENDIRKLVEKHKLSIMRLQGLHEDEVQELNTNYETQMEAMQTQNENVINDVKTEAAEKCKQLREQHNREIRELEKKYEEMLREKEAQYLAEKAKVESSAAESTNDMKEVHKQAIEGLTQFYQSSILELEEKHSHDLKNCKKSNLKRIELMKNKYEALLVEERKKYEEQLEEMLLQLKNGQQGDSYVGEKEHYVQRKLPTSSNPLLEFHEVLQKIINEGLESLSIDEVILVHTKTCFMPRKIEEEDIGSGEVSPRYEEGCRHRGLMTAEKEELLKRIFTLEHEIVIKQLETHEAIVNMETAEMCRIQELKNALCSAQQKNIELKRLLSNQSKHEMDLKIDRYMSDRQASLHETNAVEKVKELERVRAEKKRLEEELQKQKVTVKSLSAAVEAEKERYRSQRKKDAEYVESIRQRLEEALNHEQMMEAQLDYELKFRSRLEAELHSLQKSLNFLPELPPQLQIDTKVHSNGTSSEKCSEDNKKSGAEVEEKGRKHSRSKSRHRNKLKAIDN